MTSVHTMFAAPPAISMLPPRIAVGPPRMKIPPTSATSRKPVPYEYVKLPATQLHPTTAGDHVIVTRDCPSSRPHALPCMTAERMIRKRQSLEVESTQPNHQRSRLAVAPIVVVDRMTTSSVAVGVNVAVPAAA